jgi:DNA-directed RNA polymerase specialized sigma24 family protein
MLLQHAAGYTVEEIAAEHGISRQRARELIYRARLQLNQRLGRGGVDPRERH